MALNRRIPRQLIRHKARYLGLVLLIALGSILLITMNLAADTLQFSMDQLLSEGRVDDARVWLLSEPTDLESFGRHYGIDIEKRTSLDLSWQDQVTLRIFDRGERVDRPVVVEGQDIRLDNEILINPAFASAQGLTLGDSLILAGNVFRICGFYSQPDYIYPTRHESDFMTDPTQFGIAMISRRAMENLLESIDLEEITVDRSFGFRQASGQADIRSILEDRYKILRWQDRKDNARISMIRAEITGIKQMTSTMPVAIFLINCALLASILWRMIRQEFPFIGTLRALGLSRGEILRHYLVLPLVLSVSGSLLGTMGGLTLARPLLVYYATFFNLPIREPRIDLPLLLASVFLPIGLLLLTAAFVILRAVRLPPQALIRGYKRRPKAMKFEKLLHFRRVRFETKFRIRQSVRSSGKLFAAVIGVGFASMLLMMGFMSQDSYNSMLDLGFSGTYRYTYNYVFKMPQRDNPYGGEPYQVTAVQEMSRREPLVVYGLSEEGQLLQLLDPEGQRIVLRQAVASRVLADQLGLVPGQTLAVKDETAGKVHYLKIGAIAEVYTMSAVFLPIETYNSLFDRPEDSFQGIFSETTLEIDADDLIRVENMDDVMAAFDTYAGLMLISLLTMGLMSGLIALLILYILIALLIEENSRSIALLKILGYDGGEIRRLLLRTFDLPVALGYALGLPLLFAFYGKMVEQSFSEINMTMPIIISPKFIAIGFFLLYATYLVTRTLSGRKIFKVSMADALKTMQE
jgi:putative ABC transport system permease protein